MSKGKLELHKNVCLESETSQRLAFCQIKFLPEILLLLHICRKQLEKYCS